jgi:hypothetical protein
MLAAQPDHVHTVKRRAIHLAKEGSPRHYD